jgi:hypothetical protein
VLVCKTLDSRVLATFLFGIVDQAGRVLNAQLDAVGRRYICDLAHDCVVPVLQPGETINRALLPSQQACVLPRSVVWLFDECQEGSIAALHVLLPAFTLLFLEAPPYQMQARAVT